MNELRPLNHERSKVPIPRDEIAGFCRRHHIRKLSLFGSVLRDDFRPDSDVDVLVDFDRAFRWKFSTWKRNCRVLGGHKVDMVQEKYLNRGCADGSWQCRGAYAEG